MLMQRQEIPAHRLLALERHGRRDVLVFEPVKSVHLASKFNVGNRFNIEGKTMHIVES